MLISVNQENNRVIGSPGAIYFVKLIPRGFEVCSDNRTQTYTRPLNPNAHTDTHAPSQPERTHRHAGTQTHINSMAKFSVANFVDGRFSLDHFRAIYSITKYSMDNIAHDHLCT